MAVETAEVGGSLKGPNLVTDRSRFLGRGWDEAL